MFCSSCGIQLPDDANFCVKCGKPLNTSSSEFSQVRREFKNITIPMNVTWSSLANEMPKNVCDQFDSIILNHLQEEGKEGWEPEHPCDHVYLEKSHRSEWTGPIFPGFGSFKIKSVKISLSRIKKT